ncbi:MAG: MerR family transcriptional regulator, partial [Actinomycetia bacterium]|nr:MerR family transcriptional regulator [Actinomycetes bacterium]
MARMSIGEFARASGLTPKALRIYDDMGLLQPAVVDEFNGYRYYDLAQLDTALLVARLRLIDMSLARIRTVADLPPAQRHAQLVSYWRQAEADHVSRRAQVALLVDQLRDEENDMLIENGERPGVASRIGRGSRDLQLDALTTGTRLFAIADGFGDDPAVAREVLDALATLDSLHGAVDAVALLEE